MNGRNWSHKWSDLKLQASKHHRHIAFKHTSQPHCIQAYNSSKIQNAITQIAVDGIKTWDTISDLWWNAFRIYEDEHLLRAVILCMLFIVSTSVIQLTLHPFPENQLVALDKLYKWCGCQMTDIK